MRSQPIRIAAGLCLAGALLGLIFAAYSTADYAAHLDRQVHAVHCSFIPGADVSTDEGNPCKAALFSPYSAIFRQSYWGGIPISLGALGCFSFFVGLGLYLLVGPGRASRRTIQLLALAGLAPLGASIVMFGISLTELHAFCKLCVGIYTSSVLVAIAGIVAWRGLATEKDDAGPARPRGTFVVLVGGLVAFGVASLLPAVVYASALPDYRPYLTSCGKLANATEAHGALLKSRRPRRSARSSSSRIRCARRARRSTNASSAKGCSTGSTSRFRSSRSTPSATGCSTGACTRARAC